MSILISRCPGVSKTHVHALFNIKQSSEGWRFDTASEATYPPALCKKIATIIVKALTNNGFQEKPSSLSHDLQEPAQKRLYTRATLGRFVRGNKLPPIISEFRCKINVSVTASVLEGQTTPFDNTFAKVLSFTGETSGAPSNSSRMAALGIYRTPAEFITESMSLKHPIDMPSFLPDGLLENVFHLLVTPSKQVCAERLKRSSS